MERRESESVVVKGGHRKKDSHISKVKLDLKATNSLPSAKMKSKQIKTDISSNKLDDEQILREILGGIFQIHPISKSSNQAPKFSKPLGLSL